MTTSDEDRALSVQSAPKLPPSNGASHGVVPAEPLPSETRRLPRAVSRPAPVLALLRARWPRRR
jgi:hypothetical protein